METRGFTLIAGLLVPLALGSLSTPALQRVCVHQPDRLGVITVGRPAGPAIPRPRLHKQSAAVLPDPVAVNPRSPAFRTFPARWPVVSFRETFQRGARTVPVRSAWQDERLWTRLMASGQTTRCEPGRFAVRHSAERGRSPSAAHGQGEALLEKPDVFGSG
jgi:hypothetical protein